MLAARGAGELRPSEVRAAFPSGPFRFPFPLPDLRIRTGNGNEPEENATQTSGARHWARLKSRGSPQPGRVAGRRRPPASRRYDAADFSAAAWESDVKARQVALLTRGLEAARGRAEVVR
jgi:hypothetical protein